MKIKGRSKLKSIFDFVYPLVLLGFVLLVALIFIINAVLASRPAKTTSQTESNTHSPVTVPTPTAEQIQFQMDWEMYDNEQYGYTIHFPPEMGMKEYDNITYIVMLGPSQGQGQEFHDGLLVTISAIKELAGDSLNNYAETMLLKDHDPTIPLIFESRKNINLNGVEAIEITGSELGSKFTEILISHQGNIISVKANYGGEKSEQYLEIFSQMLSTLELK